MNDEAGSSSAAPLTPPPQSPTEATTAPAAANNGTNEAPSFYFSRKPRLLDLIAVLDRVIWLEITVLYLLDNSFIRFALRAMIQAVYLMPKPKGFPEQNVPQPYVGGIVGTNVLCMIFHLLNNPPEAGEATRGYLHGSLMLDFIGQQGPTSKIRLFLLDLVILLLQLVALAALGEKKEIDKKPLSEASAATEPNNQDHDAEERGEVRGASVGANSIELQDLAENTATIMQASEESRQNHTFAVSDNVASGQAVIGDFFLADTVRQQYTAYQERRDEDSQGQFVTMSGLRRRITEGLQSRGTPR